jgi:TPR repeat protein
MRTARTVLAVRAVAFAATHAIASVLALMAPAVRAAVPVVGVTEDMDAGASADAARRVALRTEGIALEHGEGVPRDRTLAATRYCEAARLGDAEAQYRLGWMMANGRGVSRDDGLAAFYFHAAAEQGLPEAVAMLARVGAPQPQLPECMRAPVSPAPPEAPVVAAATWPDAPAVIVSTAPKPLQELVKQIATKYFVHPQLALTIMEAESRFNPAALSPKNAMGLMQLIPETSARFNVKKPYDPAQNIRGGVAYLRWLLAYFEGDTALVAAAYNAGERTVDRYIGVPPYAETRAYVQRVLKGAGSTRFPYDPSVTPASPRLAAIRAAAKLPQAR